MQACFGVVVGLILIEKLKNGRICRLRTANSMP